MAVTVIQKLNGQLLKFKTEKIEIEKKDNEEQEFQLYAKVTISNEELADLSQPTVYEINVSEENFHKDLRKESSIHNQLITSHSTDPEWNPEGYVKNLGENVK